MPQSKIQVGPPIFIIGSPRSGTTLLRLMLNNHSNIVVPPECGFVVWWYRKYRHWDKHAGHDKALLDLYLEDLITSKKIETWNLDYKDLKDYIWSIRPSDYAELVSCTYVFFGLSNGTVFHRWGDKNNFHTRWIDLLHELFPDALFIHIIRDGRDVACSYRNLGRLKLRSKYAPILPTDLAKIADQWADNVEKARQSFETIGWEFVCEVRYEDLVKSAQLELSKICTFLDEPFDRRMLDYQIYNKTERQEPEEFLQWKGKTLEKLTTSEVSKHQRELTKDEILLFEKRAGHLLKEYGYLNRQ